MTYLRTSQLGGMIRRSEIPDGARIRHALATLTPHGAPARPVDSVVRALMGPDRPAAGSFMNGHNHVGREILPSGACPGCDRINDLIARAITDAATFTHPDTPT